MRIHRAPHYYARRPSALASFHPHSSYDLLIEDFVIPKTPHIYGTRMDTYLSFVWPYASKFVHASPFPSRFSDHSPSYTVRLTHERSLLFEVR